MNISFSHAAAVGTFLIAASVVPHGGALAALRGASPGDCSEYTSACGVLQWDEDAQMCLQEPAADCADVIGDDTGSPLPVQVQWDTGGRVAQSAPRKALGAILRNSTRAPLDIELGVTAIGLDQRRIRRVIKRRVRLAPGQERTLRIALKRIPVQGVGSLTSVELDATMAWEDSVLASPSDPAWLDFSADYRLATMHDFDAAVSTFDDVELRTSESFRTAWISAFGDMADPPGRILDESTGRMIDVQSVREAERRDSATYPGAGGVAYGKGTGGDAMSEYLKLLPVELPTFGMHVKVCSHWPATFVDAGFGEDYLAVKGLQQVPARFTYFDVLRPDMTKIAEGQYFDKDGCAQLVLPPGSYQVVQQASFRDDSGNEGIVRGYDATAQVSTEYFLNSNLNVVPFPGFPSALPVHIYPAMQDHVTRVAAVVTQVLVTPDNGLRQGYHCSTNPRRLSINANKGCAESSACASTCGKVFIGPPLAGEQGPHNSREKYVIAHEIGHTQQSQLLGDWPHDYGLAILPALCKCDHVLASNSLHCMQSLEYGNAAQVEGWAHFYAAKTFNDPSEENCRINYYKEFLREDGTVASPPVKIDCRNSQKWMLDHCDATGYDFGVELDWMQFLWNAHAVGSHTATMDDLDAIYRDACLSSPYPCHDYLFATESYPVTFAPPMWVLLYMAQAHFGLGDPRTQHIIQSAVDSGMWTN